MSKTTLRTSNQKQFADLYLNNQIPLKFGGEDVHFFEAYARTDGAFASRESSRP